jgi:hypothetical protein
MILFLRCSNVRGTTFAISILLPRVTKILVALQCEFKCMANPDLSVLRLFQPYGPGQIDRLAPNVIKRIRVTSAGNAASAVQQFRDDHSICERIPMKHNKPFRSFRSVFDGDR